MVAMLADWWQRREAMKKLRALLREQLMKEAYVRVVLKWQLVVRKVGGWVGRSEGGGRWGRATT